MAGFQTVKGFRDFLPQDCALRNYIFDRWRHVARCYGFSEYEGPLVEPTDLYKKKSGAEITGQLFNFITKGDEDVSLRPETTPTLARLVAAHQRQFPKPIKWFQIGSCFRYEKPQRGRTREFIQFNVDIMGEAGPAADAELAALAIDVMQSFGFAAGDFSIRLSDRRLWSRFLEGAQVSPEHADAFLQIIDKLERTPRDITDSKLAAIGLSLAQVEAFIASVDDTHEVFTPIKENLSARGLWQHVNIDPSIVRGLAYYTGSVFEVFDLKHNLRAIAGGGRYDNLVGHLSDGAVQMPACGFAMGDVVLTELLKCHENSGKAAQAWTQSQQAPDLYLIIADDTRRSEALGLLQQLRTRGHRVDHALNPAKVGKQFQAAETAGARFAAVIGAEYPVLTVKNLRTRDQMEVRAEALPEKLAELLQSPAYTGLIAG